MQYRISDTFTDSLARLAGDEQKAVKTTAFDLQINAISIVAIHAAKGLEFRSVAVMACDDDIIPLSRRIASIGDQADLEDIYNTERHLRYVACTRARDYLLVTGVEPVSEFLEDLD